MRESLYWLRLYGAANRAAILEESRNPEVGAAFRHLADVLIAKGAEVEELEAAAGYPPYVHSLTWEEA